MALPDDPTPPQTPNLPVARRFTTPELEAVIRRAVELQGGGEDELSDTEIVKIGQELGLAPATVRQAMAEVHGRGAEEKGALTTLVGARTVRASRVLRRSPAGLGSVLDAYLCETELMAPQRRFPGRTRYVRQSGLAAGMSRIARSLARTRKPLNFQQLDVAIAPIDEHSSLVEVSVDLAVVRGGLAAGVLGSSSVLATGWAAAVWATPVADPLMLLGVPAVTGAWYGMRAIYRSIFRSAEDNLESLLDRLEHDDLT
jgi:hypothetical protein